MADQSKTDAEQSADEIKDVDATQGGPRGNVHSEADETVPDQDMPPPHPA